jgi:hypothetical protein
MVLYISIILNNYFFIFSYPYNLPHVMFLLVIPNGYHEPKKEKNECDISKYKNIPFFETSPKA